MANYTIEKEGQIDFFNTFLPRSSPHMKIKDIISDDNDGVLNGNLLEFKVRISDLNSTLFQCIKYLSELRIKGKPIPSNIIIIDLNAEQAFLYKSEDYINEIEKIYYGGASKSNTGFVGKKYIDKFPYGTDLISADNLISKLKETAYTKINIDENCIVGWATHFYKSVPNARKEYFNSEIVPYLFEYEFLK